MSYCLYDSEGYVADLATITGLRNLRKEVDNAGSPQLRILLNSGTVDVSEELMNEIDAIEAEDPETKKTISDLKELAGKCKDVLIITDGMFEPNNSKNSSFTKMGKTLYSSGYPGNQHGGSPPKDKNKKWKY